MKGGDTWIMNQLKLLLYGILSLPLGFALYLIYVHFVSLLDPLLTIFFGGGILIAMLMLVFVVVKNVSYVIYSMFKKDRGVDEKGFKNF